MGKIYAGQTALRIVLNTGSDLTNATSQFIKYKNPVGEIAQFTATIDDIATGVISYSVTDTADINYVGNWTFWAFINYSDGTFVAGEPNTIRVYEEGN